MAYSKLHSTIVNSSLWTEGDAVRILFITLLAMADKDGCVYGSRPGLERIAMIDPDDSDDAWLVLMSPDRHSSDRMRAPENEGRRVEEIPGGFRLLNFAYYRGLRNDDDRREQNRVAQARFKAKANKPAKALVSHDKPAKAAGKQDSASRACSDADADAEVRTPAKAPLVRAGNPPKPSADTSPEFARFWDAYPKKKAKPEAIKAFAKQGCAAAIADIMDALTSEVRTDNWTKDRGQFIPFPATWLNRRDWENPPMVLLQRIDPITGREY